MSFERSRTTLAGIADKSLPLAGASADQADRELSLVYGHFPYLASRSKAMDDSFWAFVGTQGSPGHSAD